MKCWICSNEAGTGEHLTKASDLRSVFGHVSQGNPIYFHNSRHRNLPVRGIKSNTLKSNALLCARCNNERTQPYDRAWQRLSAYLRSKPPIRCGDLVCLHKIFPGAVKQSMLQVHLFFVKLFGCIIVEHAVPIEIAGFSAAILEQSPHPNLYIAFSPYVDRLEGRSVGISDLETAQIMGRVVYAVWLYVLDKFTIRVMYAEPNEHRKGLVHAWHPSTVRKCVRVAAF